MDAKQRLRTFLVQLGGKVEDAALTALMAYLQTKAGLLSLKTVAACVGSCTLLLYGATAPSGTALGYWLNAQQLSSAC